MVVLKATEDNIRKAARIVGKGGLVVYPTETVYGLGCNPFNAQAVNRILELKRGRKNPLPILASKIDDVEKIAYVSAKGRNLAEKFWPGQLTMVFPRKSALLYAATFGWNSVGVRIPDNQVASELIRLSGGLLIGTSANLTGEMAPRTVKEISQVLKEFAEVVLDGGVSAKGIPSTVVDLTSAELRILREGPISLTRILETLASST